MLCWSWRLASRNYFFFPLFEGIPIELMFKRVPELRLGAEVSIELVFHLTRCRLESSGCCQSAEGGAGVVN